MTTDLKKTMADVRKAYRLIYMYQRSLFSTIEAIAKEFDVIFWWWSPSNTEPVVKRTTNPFTKSAWDMLPMYSCVFIYKQGGDDLSHWILCIDINTDDQFEWDDGEEPHPSKFASPESSGSELIVSLVYSQKEVHNDKLFDYWDDCDYPDKIQGSETLEGTTFVYKRYDIGELADDKLIKDNVSKFKIFAEEEIGIQGIFQSSLP